MYIKIILKFIIVSVVFTTTNAQHNTIKKATIAYVNTFDDYASFPVTRYDKVYKDSKGKIWITTSKVFGYEVSDVYSFDGYAFKKEFLPENPIKNNKMIFSGFVDDKLFGYTASTAGYKLFYYDLLKKELITSSGAIHTKLKSNLSHNNRKAIFKQFLLENEIYSYLIQESEIIYSKKNSTSLKTLDLETINLKNLSLKLGHNLVYETEYANYMLFKNWLVSFDETNNNFEFYDVHSEKITKKNVSNIIGTNKNLTLFWDKLGRIRLVNDNKQYLFKIVDDKQIGVQLIDSQPSNGNVNISWNFFEDSQENFISFYNEDNPKLFLKHNKHKYDLSEVFNRLNLSNIVHIYGSNFLDQFIIVTRRNFYVVKVNIEDNIKKVNTGKSSRTILEYDENDLIFQYEETFFPNLNSRKVDLKSLELENEDNLCGFNRTCMTKSDGYIWGLKGGKLAKYSIDKNICREYNLEFEIIDFTVKDEQNIIFIDDNNAFWLFDHINGTVEPLLDKGSKFSIASNFYSLFFDNNGILWILSEAELFTYDFENNKLVNQEEKIKGLDFNFTSIYQIDDNQFLLGTFTKGLVVLNTKNNSYRLVTKSNDFLPNTTVASITRDQEGYYWIGTYRGVAVLDQNLNHLTNLFKKDGLVHNECNRKSSKLLNDGRVVIGSLKGLSVIKADKIIKSTENKKQHSIYFTEIKYYDSKLKKEVSSTDYSEKEQSIKLGPSNTTLNLEFATSNYIYPLENLYSYKIKGIENEWKKLGKTPKLSLYSLPAGEYTISVKGFDHNGIPTQNILQLNVIVDDYFYNEAWFFVLLFFMLGGAVLVWINTLNKRVKVATKKINQDKVIIEQQSKKLEALDQAKTTFFTNITHEFRTPLTIINSVVDLMKREGHSNHEKEIGEIEQNANRLLDMVNQILALRKLESQKMSLSLIQSDIVTYIDYIIDSHQYFALNKGISLKPTYSDQSIMMDFDVQKFKTILTNLLSNAIKYTPEGGLINVEVTTRNDDVLNISIQDNGVGIYSGDLNHIVDVSHSSENIFNSENSSGIGLNLTHKLVDLHNGSLKISSQVNKGTLVILELPIQKQAKKESLNLSLSNSKESIGDNRIIDDELETEKSTTILIVEDNDSLRHILYSQLKGYRILMARHGEEGIEKAKINIPDIIISDIMMPYKNGYELCEEIKQNMATSHIPVVFLTAKADHESKIEGFKSKADAYIYKPYDKEELRLVINNLLESRAKLQEAYKNLSEDSARTNQPKEDQFILELKALISKNLKDESYGIKDICEDLKISRMHLHNKLKALTGLTTSHYIMLVRLQKAKELLKNTTLNINEISFEVGLSNRNYFTKSFKHEFGVSPSQWRKNFT